MAVLEVALDIARGMLHLHAQNVIHSDLKVHLVNLGGKVRRSSIVASVQAGNIMLTSNVCNTCGAVAKIADFGVSVQMDLAETHVSQWTSGSVIAQRTVRGSSNQISPASSDTRLPPHAPLPMIPLTPKTAR